MINPFGVKEKLKKNKDKIVFWETFQTPKPVLDREVF